MRQGWPSRQMVVLQQGLLAVHVEGQLEEVLRPGDQAGEEALLTVPSEQQLTKVRSGTPAAGTMCPPG